MRTLDRSSQLLAAAAGRAFKLRDGKHASPMTSRRARVLIYLTLCWLLYNALVAARWLHRRSLRIRCSSSSRTSRQIGTRRLSTRLRTFPRRRGPSLRSRPTRTHVISGSPSSARRSGSARRRPSLRRTTPCLPDCPSGARRGTSKPPPCRPWSTPSRTVTMPHHIALVTLLFS